MEVGIIPDDLYRRYQELQTYVGWTEDDARRLHAVGPLLAPSFPALIDDFYEEIQRHPEALKVITGGKAQIERLKGTLMGWISELFSGHYDNNYVVRRWRVGRRHVEIALDQVYTNVALSRLRTGLLRALQNHWQGDSLLNPPPITGGGQGGGDLQAVVLSLNKLLDLDLATIEDAYQAEYVARQQRSERLAAIGQVAGGIAHELRNPLNVVKTSVYYLLNARNATTEKKAEHLQRIERHVLLADGVITALSNFARLPLPNMRPFAVRKCVEEALEINALPDNCRATLEFPPDLPCALADVDQVRIVLGNLIRNGREAMPQGGDLSITARQVDESVEVAVADRGVGISAEHLGRIMEPLYSTKARGLGLGLAIARSILQKNKGNLRVSSEPGQGSTFTVRLAAALAEEHTTP